MQCGCIGDIQQTTIPYNSYSVYQQSCDSMAFVVWTYLICVSLVSMRVSKDGCFSVFLFAIFNLLPKFTDLQVYLIQFLVLLCVPRCPLDDIVFDGFQIIDDLIESFCGFHLFSSFVSLHFFYFLFFFCNFCSHFVQNKSNKNGPFVLYLFACFVFWYHK